MSLRKCQAIKNGLVHIEGLFHRWADTGSATAALIEDEDGVIHWWLDDIKFLEPEHPRVRVHSDSYGAKAGEFHGWTTAKNIPCGIVRFDDGSCDTFHVNVIQFQSREAR